jgi:diacylglycerol kinase family enzyme
MTIILNPTAAGGKAMKKWSTLLEAMPAILEGSALSVLEGPGSAGMAVREALARGERYFVAAGGDGTINLLLETLMRAGFAKDAALGAIGLGSSNDFHKPYRKEDCVSGIPMKLDFVRARPRDVGSFVYAPEGTRRYFLVNASIGAAAEANDFFNHPDRLLAFQKRHAPPSAIYYAALRTIFSYRNLSVTISSSGEGSFQARLTNLGVIKSPHFSGDLSYGGVPSYDDGLLKLYLCEDLNRRELLMLLRALGRKNGPRAAGVLKTWSSPDLSVRSDAPFAVEFDGEVVRTAAADFTVYQKSLKVCP